MDLFTGGGSYVLFQRSMSGPIPMFKINIKFSLRNCERRRHRRLLIKKCSEDAIF
jgi:hypothetical protein